MKEYVLNHNQQQNRDHEVHTTSCNYAPTSNYERLGWFSSCTEPVRKAKEMYPLRKINGCYHCCNSCHTS